MNIHKYQLDVVTSRGRSMDSTKEVTSAVAPVALHLLIWS